MTQQTQTKQLRELFEVTKGKKVRILDKKTRNSIPYLLIDTLRGKEPEFFTEDQKITQAEKKDILMVFDGANSGLVGTGLNGAVGSTIARLRPQKEMNTKYITYFLSFNFSNLNQDIKGSAIPHIKPKKLLGLTIRYPSLQEQSQIVSAIETQFTRLDESVKSLNAVQKKLEVYRKAVLKKAFEKVTQIKRLDQICEKVTQGPNPKLKDYGGEVGNYVLKTKDFYNYKVLYEKCNLVGRELIKEWERFILRDGDVILAIVGVGSIGKINVFREQPNKKYIFTRATGLIRPNKGETDSEYLHYFFLSQQGSKLIEKGIGGSTGQLVIKTSYLKELEIPAPSFLEQQQIVQAIESKFSVIDKLEQVVEQSLIKSEKLRKSILKSAFEGKLVKNEQY